MLELATFTPHGPFTPAPRAREQFPNAARPARSRCSTRRSAEAAPSWLPTRAADEPARSPTIDRELPQAGAVRAGDRRDDRRDPRASCARLGVGGQHVHRVQLRQRLPHGPAAADARASRRTATTTSACRWSSPGRACRAGALGQARGRERRPAADLPGARRRADRPRVEGRSLAGRSCAGSRRASWRDATLIEHRGPNTGDGDPDAQAGSRQPAELRRAALRRTRSTSSTTTRRSPPEYYDLARDPLERRNIYPSLSRGAQGGAGRRSSRAMRACSGGASCHEADAGP